MNSGHSREATSEPGRRIRPESSHAPPRCTRHHPATQRRPGHRFRTAPRPRRILCESRGRNPPFVTKFKARINGVSSLQLRRNLTGQVDSSALLWLGQCECTVALVVAATQDTKLGGYHSRQSLPHTSLSESGTSPIHHICRPCTSPESQPAPHKNSSNSNCMIPGRSENPVGKAVAELSAALPLNPSGSTRAEGRGCFRSIHSSGWRAVCLDCRAVPVFAS